MKPSPASQAPSAGATGVLEPPTLDPQAVTLAIQVARLLYTVRFKAIRGVQEVVIAASSPTRAQEVAKAWVQSMPGRTVLQVLPLIVADERTLDQGLPDNSNPTTEDISRQ